MALNWYIVNNKLFELKGGKPTDEWIAEWNKWVDISKTIVGCLNWERYEENHQESGGEVEQSVEGQVGGNSPSP